MKTMQTLKHMGYTKHKAQVPEKCAILVLLSLGLIAYYGLVVSVGSLLMFMDEFITENMLMHKAKFLPAIKMKPPVVQKVPVGWEILRQLVCDYEQSFYNSLLKTEQWTRLA